MTPLVLLPGMMCDVRLFLPQIAVIGTERAIHLAPISGHKTVEALAAEILAQAPPRFALAGLSMGGIVAMEVLRQAAGRVDRVALIDTNPRAELPEAQAIRALQIKKVRSGQLREVVRDELKPNYLIDGPRKSAILDVCMSMAMQAGSEVFVRQSLALRDRPDQQETLAKVAVPTLILMGAEDRLCPRDRHELMHHLVKGSRFEVIAGAAHLPTLEQPEQTTAAMVRWLEE